MSFIVLRDGSRVEVAKIDTYQGALDALVDLDESIIAIEEQLERARAAGETDSPWAIKARTALKHRRRARPHLQERIGQLRRLDKAGAHEILLQETAARRASWHQAFVEAVRASVSSEEFRRFSEKADQVASTTASLARHGASA